jgi:hypothetical protein
MKGAIGLLILMISATLTSAAYIELSGTETRLHAYAGLLPILILVCAMLGTGMMVYWFLSRDQDYTLRSLMNEALTDIRRIRQNEKLDYRTLHTTRSRQREEKKR